MDLIQGPLWLRDLSLTVEDFRGVGGWNWDLISFELPDTIKDRIKAVSIQDFGQREDSLMWRFTRDGDFSTKLAYL